MEILFQFIIKILDNVLGTFKTIYISKEKYFYGALFNALSSYFYFIAIAKMTKSNSQLMIIVMCIAVFIGTFLPGITIKRSERDKLYIFDITADTFSNGTYFADKIREHNIAIKTYKAYDSQMTPTLSCKVYCMNKEESRVVNSLIKPNFKYNIYTPLEIGE